MNFTAAPGPRRIPASVKEPLDFVNLFFTDQLIGLIVNETNRYATQWIRNHTEYLRRKPHSRVHLWIRQGNTTPQEIRAFLAIVINMGLIKKPMIRAYWNISSVSQSTPWFPERFSEKRFVLLLKFLHFADNEQMPAGGDATNKLYKIEQVVKILNTAFLRYYEPHVNIAIDESMIGYRGKTPHLRQYMPQKHHAKFGVKLWCLCDSKGGYTHHFEIYKGAHVAEDAGAEGVTFNLVLRLLENGKCLDKGYHLALDNYFSSPALFFELFNRSTTATGTVRANRKGLSKQVLQAKLKSGEVCERRKGPLLCVGYKDGGKRPILITTREKAGFITENNSKGREVTRPRCVSLYNKTMGGVDLSDARLYSYLSERRTLKWTTKVAFGLFGRACLNSYILYEQCTPGHKMSRYQFMVSVVEGLVGDFHPPVATKKRRTKAQIEADRAEVPIPNPPTHIVEPAPSQCKLEKLPVGKRRNCVYQHNARTRSSWICPSCDVGLCPPCFTPYHDNKRRRL